MGRTKATTLDRPPGGVACLACAKTDGTHAIGCPNNICPDCGSASGSHHEPCPRSSERNGTVLSGTTGAPIADEDADEDDDEDDEPQTKGARRNPPDLLEDPPAIGDVAMFVRLQEAYNAGEITGVKQPKASAKMCESYRIAGGKEIGCSSLAMFRALDEHPCPSCEKMLSKKHSYFCLAHEALRLAGKPVNPQTSLLDGVR